MSEKLRTTIARALPAYADLTTLRAKFEKQQDAREREKLAGELAFAWAEYSPRNALTWLESLKAPAEKTAATSTFMKAWCEGDPVEAEQWLVTLDSGPQRDAAVVAYLSSIKFLDTVTAITWAASIDEGSLREAAVQAVVKAVRTPDEALDAAEAMNTVGKLPDAERTKWVDQLTSLATKPSTPP